MCSRANTNFRHVFYIQTAWNDMGNNLGTIVPFTNTRYHVILLDAHGVMQIWIFAWYRHRLSLYDPRTISIIGHDIQYIPRNMHKVFALLCFVVVIYWLIFPYPSGLLHWHRGNLTIAPVPAKQPWWIWINTSCDFIMNDCITTTK